MNDAIENAVAIVGMSCKLPVAETPEQFWQALADGVEAVTFFSDEQLLAKGVPAQRLADAHYVKAGVQLPGRQCFDAGFFGIAPREASLMDPQQRLLLEGAYRALEHGGYAPEQSGLETGVFVGADASSYFVQNILPNQQAMADTDPVQLIYTNSSMATQIAYRLNLRGPCLDVNTACSTSLVAVHLACRSLLMYECDMALAGGASVQAAEPLGYQYRPDSILSPDGHCRAFDAAAAGTVAGQGVALVLLKRHEDALRDGDTIYATIRGSAINNDGANKVGYTAPAVEGQIAVLQRALAAAAVRPEQVSYVECHGTGTALGDPIELTALAEVYGGQAQARPTACHLGSLKSNLGHLNSAAGVAGLLKTALALRHRQIPASLHFTGLTPKVRLGAAKLAVNASLRDWGAGSQPLHAAVSSFGIGGTNAHVVLQSHQEAPAPAVPPRASLLTLSAKTPAALAQKRVDFAAFLQTCSDTAFADACYTANVGRSRFAYRQALAAPDRQTCIAQLLATASEPAAPVAVAGLVFVLDDAGPALIQLGRSLYEQVPHFRRTLDTAACTLAGEARCDLNAALLPGAAPIHRAQHQSLAFAVLYGLAALWMHWGVRPALMVGDEVGEFAAACHAGVLGFGDAWHLLRLRTSAAPANGPDPFAAAFERIRLAAPLLAYTSSLSGERVDAEALREPGYWRQPRTGSGFATALRDAAGKPDASLLGLAGLGWRAALAPAGQVRCFGAGLEAGDEALPHLFSVAAQLWQAGIELDWSTFYDVPGRRIAIPTYPFEAQRHWLDAPVPQPGPQVAVPATPAAAVAGQNFLAPRTELEREIAAIWSQLLGVEHVGVLDDFFELGGHSLLATQINSRIHAAFGIQLTLDDLFDMPTVAGTVELLLRQQLAEAEQAHSRAGAEA